MDNVHVPRPANSEPWPYNPLVTLIRLHGTDVIADTVDRYRHDHGFQVSHFDLAVQVMIVSCSYEPDEVWLTDGDDVAIATELVAKGAPKEAGEVLEHALARGRVRLNTELIEDIAADQATRLHEIHAANQEEFDLPDHSSDVFAGFPRGAELVGQHLTRGGDAADDGYEVVATEKLSRTKVVFRPVDLELSQAYVTSFHYLHAARGDDLLAFGAFVDGERLPFAIVSYAAVNRRYKQNILRAAGLDPGTSLELTRAWNSEFSPKNTMSKLYAYAHACILLLHQRQRQETQAIITAVNPNLGFRGSAFRAVGFGVIGHKPTMFHYLVDGVGRRSYVPRRALADLDRSAPGHARVATARLPLLPTKELAVILHGRTRLRPVTAVVYHVSAEEYAHDGDEMRRPSHPHHGGVPRHRDEPAAASPTALPEQRGPRAPEPRAPGSPEPGAPEPQDA